MREIILDTETTGLDPAEGHRIIEIGALEMVDQVPSGKTYHQYINPMREIEADAAAVHGLTNERLAGEPVFADIADDFLGFIGDAKLVIHNAPFDMGFINAELEALGRGAIPMTRVIDTLAMARTKFPGARASLDALCTRFGIDNSHRELHGAMVDTDLLAQVYIELTGGRQIGLAFAKDQNDADAVSASDTAAAATVETAADKPVRAPRSHAATEEEIKAHDAFVEGLDDPLWRKL